VHTRLLSFLSDIERALAADDPSPEGGAWLNHRTVNYQLGLARLSLAATTPEGGRQPRGAILLQCFKLADGTPCLKAQFSWAGSASTSTHALYAKPGTNWLTESRQLAALWLAGPPAPSAAASVEDEAETPLAATAS
jgi:hypothetical protein